MLNATGEGEPVYRRIGFEKVGRGKTWWLHAETLEAPPPPSWQVALAEAAGRGDIQSLQSLASSITSDALDTPLPSGSTLVQVATQLEQPAAVQWLIDHGATLDLLSAWDLGWHDRGRQL